MKFLPYENYCLFTRLPIDEVKQRLKDNTEPRKWFRFGIFPSGSNREFEGEVMGDIFNINRIVVSNLTTRPTMNGTISVENNGANIFLDMRMRADAIYWFVLVLAGLLILAFTLLFQHNFHIKAYLAFLPLIFVYVIVTLFFKFEASMSKNFLSNLIEAEEI
jgi:hypothetical protein